jgi:hypothetical protein
MRVLVAAALVLVSSAVRGQSVRILGVDGRPVADARVLFVCHERLEGLREASAWLASKGRETAPIVELQGGGAGVVAITDENGVAAPLACGGLGWSAWVVRGGLGIEAALARFDPDEGPTMTELRLRPLRRVRVLDRRGKPAEGVEVASDQSSRAVETDAEGRAVLPQLAKARYDTESKGLRWVAPEAELVVPWAGDGAETVLRLPPVGRLVVIDGEHDPDGRPAMLSLGQYHQDIERRMWGGRLTFAHVPANKWIELRLRGGYWAAYERVVSLEEGETRVVTLRGAPVPVVVRGRAVVPGGTSEKLGVFAFFADRDPGEPAVEAGIEGGSFTLTMPSRRSAAGRDVVIFVKPAPEPAPASSPWEPLRKRLGDPDAKGAFDLGLLTPAVIEPWLAGVVTDGDGRAMPGFVFQVDWLGCAGSGGWSGGWGGDPMPEPDPSRPELEGWPRKVRTDANGRFSVTGWTRRRAFGFTLPDGTVFGDRALSPSTDLHLVAPGSQRIEVVADGNAARTTDRRVTLTFEARRESSDPRAMPVVVQNTTWAHPDSDDPENRSWHALLELAPGRWTITLRVDDATEIVASAVVDVPAGRAEVGAMRVLLGAVRSVAPAPAFRHASLRILRADGSGCPDPSVWMRAHQGDGWEECVREDEGLSIYSPFELSFSGETVEVVASASGFVPALIRLGEGPASVVLGAARPATLGVRVIPIPAGVQESVVWRVRVDYLRPIPTAGVAEHASAEMRRSVQWWRVTGGSRVVFEIEGPGVYEVALVAGDLVYGSREVTIGGGDPVDVVITVDPDSPGMRARTTGIGW